MSSRKDHNKSRHGCLRCKERRVKCNEIGPCNHCIRRREACSLTEPSFNDSSSTRSSPCSISATEPSTSFLTPFLFNSPIPDRLPLLDPEWSQDLFLMSHFVVSTCKTITSRPAIIYMWQHVVPKDAVSHSFLMHGLLAFSALHLASLHQDTPLRYHYAQLCQSHQAKAIPEFRRALLDLKPESSGPCFAMGSILACLAVAAVSDNRLELALNDWGFANEGIIVPQSVVCFDTLLSLFTLTRGIRSILEPSWAWNTFSCSPYAVAVHGHGAVDFDVFQLPHQISHSYVELRQGIEDIAESELSDIQKTACLAALHEREHIEKDLVFHQETAKSQPQPTNTDTAPQNNIEPSFLFRWFVTVPDEFVSLLAIRNSAAMEILRGFISLLEPLEDAWYLHGFVANANQALGNTETNM